MEGYPSHHFQLIGRKKEMATFKDLLSRSIGGMGNTLLVSGEAGIGKTRLIEEYRRYASDRVKIMNGSATLDSLEPFQIFSKALEGISNQPLFRNLEHTSFTTIFVVDRAGLLLAQASSVENELDADIFTGMLSAVQGFVKDSFNISGEKKGGLGRLEYGDKKIIIEHGQHIFLTAVFDGAEHRDMKQLVKRTVEAIEMDHGDILEAWEGNMDQMMPVQDMISSLANAKFLVKQELEGTTLKTERLRIADQVLVEVTELSKIQPLLILLEDLHWAEESSLFVLNYLARNIRNERIMILGTLRPGESQILDQRLEKMRKENMIIDQKLDILGTEEVASLAFELFADNTFSEDFIETLAGKCRGNPFFTIELLRQMADEGSIGEKNGKYTLLSEDYSIPSSIEDVVHRKLERLGPDEMALVEYASCIALQFDREILSSIQIVVDIPTTLDRLTDTGIIATYGDHIEFSHALFQDAIYQSMGNRWKSVYHKNIGDYYEENFGMEIESVIYELASHYSRSKEYSKAFDYCIRAGEKAESEFAPEQSLELYKSALSAHRNLRKPDSKETALELLEKIGDIQELVGEWDDALLIFDEAFGISSDDEIKARMLRKSGAVYESRGDYDEALKALDKAKIQIDGRSSKEYARICNLEGGIYGKKGERDKGLAILKEGLAIFEEKGDSLKDIAKLFRAIGFLQLNLGQLGPALENYQKSLKIMEDIGNEHGMAAALNNIGVLYHDKGELDYSLDYYLRSLRIKEKIGDIDGVSISLG
ncbi:MAG: tetratricopeptide repeat protein, partial [Thermoplasmata archaeon]|nr:tetratricopeptide repeat protein [Thermoplasmata archaeon]